MTRSRLTLLGILLWAFFLRLLNLGGRALWYDEAFAILYAEKSFAQMWYGTVTSVQGAAADVHPLFYYALLHGWMDLVGQSAFAVRLLSAGLSAGTVAVVWRLAKTISQPTGAKQGTSDRLALVAALVFAAAPFALAYAQEARMYALLGFSSALLVLAYVRLEEGAGRMWWLVLVASGAAMLYAHNLAVFFGAALAVVVVIKVWRTRDWRVLFRFAAAGAVILLLWIPWLTLIPSQLGKIQQAYWIGTPDGLAVLQTVLTFVVDFDNARVPPLLLPLGLVSALLIILLLGMEIARGGWRDPRVALFAWLLLAPPVLILLVSLWRPVYLTRALMPSFVMLTLLVGWLLTRLPRVMAWIVGGVLLVSAVVSYFFYFTYADFPRPPFQDALTYLNTQTHAGDAIVHDNKMSFFPMYYYSRAAPLAQHFVADPQGGGSDTLALPTQEALGLHAEELAQAVGQSDRVWFVMFREAREESAQAHNLEWLQANYRETEQREFHDLELYLFQR